MRAKELISKLSAAEDNEVVVRVVRKEETIGRSPSLPVTGVWLGFDWDHGRTFITLEEDVTQLTPAEVDDLVKLKSMLSSLRGRSVWEDASKVYIKKSVVIDELEKLSLANKDTDLTFKIFDLVRKIDKEKL